MTPITGSVERAIAWKALSNLKTSSLYHKEPKKGEGGKGLSSSTLLPFLCREGS
jgi:hypothetical protein